MSKELEVLNSFHAELLINPDEQSNYFPAGQDKELDVADYIIKSVPKQIKHNPALDSYITFAKIYGCVLIVFDGLRILSIFINYNDYSSEGRYYYTLHYFLTIANSILYLLIGLYCIYAAYIGNTEKIIHNYVLIMGILLAVFVLISIDHAYLSLAFKVCDQWVEWLVCMVLYLWGYVCHYDFHKKLKKSNFHHNYRFT